MRKVCHRNLRRDLEQNDLVGQVLLPNNIFNFEHSRPEPLSLVCASLRPLARLKRAFGPDRFAVGREKVHVHGHINL